MSKKMLARGKTASTSPARGKRIALVGAAAGALIIIAAAAVRRQS